MTRLRFGPALLGALALALALSACSGSDDAETLSLTAARNEILRQATSGYGSVVDVGEVRCPQEVPREKGATFFCTVELDGQTLRVNVEQKDDQGNVRFYEAHAVLDVKRMNDTLASYTAEQGKPTSRVSCGESTVLVRSPGDEIECSVAFADGSTAVATFGVTDTKGNTPILSIEPSR
jgi:major membrane immunogen (membrane-anchored lipoprotein)